MDEDAAGLTFEELDPIKDADDSQTPVPMIINSSELRGAGFNLQEVMRRRHAGKTHARRGAAPA